MQFASYPRITSLASDDLILVHQDSSGAEKTIEAKDAASSLVNITDSIVISELKAKSVVSIGTGASVNVAGYYSIGDGGGGVFYYDSS